MNLKSLTALIFSLAVISMNLVKAESGFANAVELFKQNKFLEAQSYCQPEIKNDGENAQNARLLQIIISNILGDENLAFNCFDEFLKKTENPGAYIYALRAESALYKNKEPESDRIDRFIELSKNSKLTNTDKAYLYEDISREYINIYKKSKAEKYGKMIGGIYDWQIVGEFENISGSGFDKNFDPISHPESDCIFKNKVNANVKWFTLVPPLNCKWIDLTQNFNHLNAIIFAQTFCLSKEEQTVQLRIGVSGSLKVWVNDALCISESEERNNGLDSYIASIKLKKGYNRILLQLGVSEIERCNFFARITDASGLSLENLEYSSSYQKYSKETAINISESEFYIESYFKSLIAKDTNSFINKLMLAKTYTISGNLPLAIETYLEMLKTAPNSSYIYTQLSNLYSADYDQTNSGSAVEKIKQLDPECPLALKLSFDEDINNEKYSDAKETLKKYAKISMNNLSILEMQIILAAKENRVEDLARIIETAYKEYPHYSKFLTMKIYYETEAKKDVYNATKILEKYTKDYNDQFAISMLSNIYLNNGELQKYIELFQNLSEYSPETISINNTLGNLNFKVQDYLKAIEYFKACIAVAPYYGTLYDNLGSSYKELGNNSKAIENFTKCLEYNPSNFLVREKLRALEDKKLYSDYFSKPKLNEIYSASEKDSLPEGSNAEILLCQKDKVIVSGGVYEDKYTILIKVLNKQGVDDFKEYSISTDGSNDFNIEKAEVIKKNGNKTKGEIDDDIIVFTNLQEGDAISIIYKLRGAQYGPLSKYFWDDFSFALSYPIKEIKYSILVEPGNKFEYKMSNSDLKPEIKNVDGYTLYEWKMKNIPAIVFEPCMPNYNDCSPVLNVSSIPNWNFISKWYYDIYSTKANSNREVNQAFKEIFPNGIANISDLDKAKKIYEYIVKNIRYSFASFRQNGVIPQNSSKVLTTKLGDCKDVTTLFVALAQLAGLEAHPSLVSTKDYGEKHLELPNIDFNHAIATLVLDNKKYFIELTTDKYPFNTISKNLKGSLALEINEKNIDSLQKIPGKEISANSIKRVSELRFENDKMFATITSTKKGAIGGDTRNAYAYKSEDERKKSIIQGLSRVVSKFILDKLEFSNDLMTLSDEVNYKYNLTIPGALSKISNLFSFKPLFLDPVETSMVENDKRVYPLLIDKFTESDLKEEFIKIEIPEDKVIEALPESQNINNEFGEYELTFTQNENVINIYKKIRFKKDVIYPNEYLAFRDFIWTLSKFENEQIALKENKKK